jgi:hypothetical protein
MRPAVAPSATCFTARTVEILRKQQGIGTKAAHPGTRPESLVLPTVLSLRPESTVPVDAAASEEAMIHHALSQPEEGDCQRKKEQDPPNFEPRRSLS